MNNPPKRLIRTLIGSGLLILLILTALRAARFAQAAPKIQHSAPQAQASNPPRPQPLTLSDEQDRYPLGLHLEILEDPSGTLSIADVTSPPYDTQFVPNQSAVPNYGYTDSAYWVRFSLNNQAHQADPWLLEQSFANMHYIDLYTPLAGGEGFTVKQTGVLRPPTTRDLIYPHIVFDLSIPPQSQQIYYLRFQSGASMTLPLILWRQTAFLNDTFLNQIWQGIFYGLLIGLLFYNLFLLFSLRDASYLYLVLILASLLVQEIAYDGYWAIYVTPDSVYLKEKIIIWSFILLFGMIVSFSETFLELRTRLPMLHRISLLILAGWAALLLATFFVSYRLSASLGAPWALVSLLAVLIAGLFSWKSGFRPARYFIIAWFGMLVSIFWVLLIRMGLVPSTWYSENLYRLGIAWMTVSWSLALADRVNLLKANAEDANRALQNSEHRLRQILEGLPIGVVVYGKDRRPTYANQRTTAILSNPAQGIKPDISAGRRLENAIDYFSLHKAGSEQPYPLESFPIYSALQGELAAADDIEANLVDKRVPLEIWASPVRDDLGEVESAVVAFQDITQRKQTEMALRISEKRFRVIAENNFDGIAFMGRDRKVLYVSPSYLRLVGKTTEEVIGQSGVGLVHPDDREFTAKKFNEVLQQPNTRISAEYRISHKDGSWIWVETFAINMLDDPDVQAVVLNSHNITERKLAEAELDDYRKNLESLVEGRTSELNTTNEQLRQRLEWLSAINLVNQIMARSADFAEIYLKILEIINRLFRVRDSFISELVGDENQVKILAHSCHSDLHPELAGTLITLPVGALSASSLEQGKAAFVPAEQLSPINESILKHLQVSEYQGIMFVPLRLRDTLYGYLGLEMHDSGRIITSGEAELLDIFSMDIAQLIEDNRLTEQTKALITAEERNRLARELHDSVTQTLFTASVLAEATPRLWDKDQAIARQNMEKLSILLRGALAEMRSMLIELRAGELSNQTLDRLLTTLVEAARARTHAVISLSKTGFPELPGDVSLTLYRIAREALNNAMIHAAATHIHVSLLAEPGLVELRIQDDGCGFNPGMVPTGHLGIKIMTERAAEIGAELQILSEPHHGTQLVITWSDKAEETCDDE